MAWQFRPGLDPHTQLKDMEKTLSLDNLGATEIKTDFPKATEETNLHLVDNGGTLHLVVTTKGKRYKMTGNIF